MKQLSLIAAACLLSCSAFADNNNVNVTGAGNNTAGHDLNVNSGAGSGSTFSPAMNNDIRNTNTAIAAGGAGGRGEASARAGDNTVQVDASNKSVYKERKQAPAVFAPGLVAGFDCLGSKSGGGSVAGFGLTFGSTEANEDCINVYLSRVAFERGEPDTAIGIMCESKKYARHSKKCAELEPRQASAYRAEYAGDYASRSDYPNAYGSDSPKH